MRLLGEGHAPQRRSSGRLRESDDPRTLREAYERSGELAMTMYLLQAMPIFAAREKALPASRHVLDEVLQSLLWRIHHVHVHHEDEGHNGDVSTMLRPQMLAEFQSWAERQLQAYHAGSSSSDITDSGTARKTTPNSDVSMNMLNAESADNIKLPLQFPTANSNLLNSSKASLAEMGSARIGFAPRIPRSTALDPPGDLSAAVACDALWRLGRNMPELRIIHAQLAPAVFRGYKTPQTSSVYMLESWRDAARTGSCVERDRADFLIKVFENASPKAQGTFLAETLQGLSKNPRDLQRSESMQHLLMACHNKTPLAFVAFLVHAASADELEKADFHAINFSPRVSKILARKSLARLKPARTKPKHQNPDHISLVKNSCLDNAEKGENGLWQAEGEKKVKGGEVARVSSSRDTTHRDEEQCEQKTTAKRTPSPASALTRPGVAKKHSQTSPRARIGLAHSSQSLQEEPLQQEVSRGDSPSYEKVDNNNLDNHAGKDFEGDFEEDSEEESSFEWDGFVEEEDNEDEEGRQGNKEQTLGTSKASRLVTADKPGKVEDEKKVLLQLVEEEEDRQVLVAALTLLARKVAKDEVARIRAHRSSTLAEAISLLLPDLDTK